MPFFSPQTLQLSHKSKVGGLKKLDFKCGVHFVHLFVLVKSEEKKQDTFKNWPLIKNPQFLSYPHETW